MKKYLYLLMIVLMAYNTSGQTFSEFFQQDKTQKKYLLKQIAELQSYIELARKGYGIVSDGLNFIGDLKNGTFNLDKNYFSSLSNISSAVKKDNNIANTLALRSSINDLYNKAKQGGQSNYLSTDEKDYIQKVWSNLLDKCSDDITQLDNLTTAGNYQMTEDERLQAIDKVYLDIQDKNKFANSFYNEVKVFINQRTKEKIETETLKGIYDEADY